MSAAVVFNEACYMEGHSFGDGGVCWRCGFRLRCICGSFVRVDTFDGHLDKCRVVAAAPSRE